MQSCPAVCHDVREQADVDREYTRIYTSAYYVHGKRHEAAYQQIPSGISAAWCTQYLENQVCGDAKYYVGQHLVLYECN